MGAGHVTMTSVPAVVNMKHTGHTCDRCDVVHGHYAAFISNLLDMWLASV